VGNEYGMIANDESTDTNRVRLIDWRPLEGAERIEKLEAKAK
jgi:hypothetical protein